MVTEGFWGWEMTNCRDVDGGSVGGGNWRYSGIARIEGGDWFLLMGKSGGDRSAMGRWGAVGRRWKVVCKRNWRRRGRGLHGTSGRL